MILNLPRYLFVSFLILAPLSSSYNLYATNSSTSISLEYSVLKVLPNDICTISGKPLSKDDICLLVGKKRIPLKKEVLIKFLSQPEKYLKEIPDLSISDPHTTDVPQQKLKYILAQVIPGENCLFSGLPLGQDDICLIVSGRRLTLKKEALKFFLEHPQKIFDKVKLSGALFVDEMNQSRQLELKWFLLGLYLFAGLIFGALSAQAAIKKGFKPLIWFLLGIFTTIIGYCIILAKSSEHKVSIPSGKTKVPSTADPIPCPNCSYENHPKATNCYGCGKSLSS